MVEFMSLRTAALIFVGLWIACVIYGVAGSAFRTLEKAPPEEVQEA